MVIGSIAGAFIAAAESVITAQLRRDPTNGRSRPAAAAAPCPLTMHPILVILLFLVMPLLLAMPLLLTMLLFPVITPLLMMLLFLLLPLLFLVMLLSPPAVLFRRNRRAAWRGKRRGRVTRGEVAHQGV